MKKKRFNQKGVAAYFYLFFFFSLMLLFLFAVAIPFMQTFNIEAYSMGEEILQQSQGAIDDIDNTEVRESIQGMVDNQLDSTETQIDILGTFFQYGWLIIILIVLLIIFMATRETVETAIA